MAAYGYPTDRVPENPLHRWLALRYPSPLGYWYPPLITVTVWLHGGMPDGG